jgi:alkanesulfonate monooxygenase SsuD/methylene tetrahydromethanopterin reductase-like flavin-dependent oxidoreductase (luciferase family)
MRLGAIVLQMDRWSELRRTWQSIETAGVDVGYAFDHLTHPTAAGRWLADGWTVLAAAAEATTTIELGPLVASAAVRTPVTLARAAATLHDISGGRCVLGLGAGNPRDAAADRGESPSPGELFGRCADLVRGLRELWSGAASYEGSQLSYSGIETTPLAPGTAAPPPLLLAAHGPRGFDLAAREADGWNTFGGFEIAGKGADELWAMLREQQDAVTAACERVDRDPSTLLRSVLVGYGAFNPLSSEQALVDTVGRAQEEGFDEVDVYWPSTDPATRWYGDRDTALSAVAAVRSAYGSS